MSSSEIAFLALGLVLGAALGAAFLAAVRTRPAPRREVRLTITPNSIGGRRASTLADPVSARDRRPVPGSPEDAAWPDRPDEDPADRGPDLPDEQPGTTPMRTRVPSAPVTVPSSAVGISVGGGPGVHGSPAQERMPASSTRSSVAVADRPASAPSSPSPSPSSSPALAPPPAPALPPAFALPPAPAPASAPAPAPAPARPASTLRAVLDVGRPAAVRPVRPRLAASDTRPSLSPVAVGIAVGRTAVALASDPLETGAAPSAASSPVGPANPVAADACAEARAAVDARCAEATAARERSRAAVDAMREAQRAFDTLRERVDEARGTGDPGAVAQAKAALHRSYRAAIDAAASADEAEAAAREWLSEINRVNGEARSAIRLLESGAAQLRDQLPVLERLAVEADAARILSDGAEEACRTAREELARCEEAVFATLPPPPPEEPHPFAGTWPTQHDMAPGPKRMLPPSEVLAGRPAIVRILRGDRAARERLVATIAAADTADAATWQLRVAALVDAIAARAIEDGCLDLPDDDPFWGLFAERERREVVAALASLGFRYDGLGGFADGRVPSTRDLTLAVGYAGLDRMRIRAWPRDSELAGLYERATVAADDWLTDRAGDLGLREVVEALGSRAGDLVPVWNAWGRIRQALLTSD